MAALYADENFPLQVVEALRVLGHDVLTAQEARQANRAVEDTEVLAFASAGGRAVLTLNRRDFIALHAVRGDHAGVIVCTQDPDTDGQAGRIHEALTIIERLPGSLIRVNRPAR